MRAKHTFLVVACGTTAAALAYYYWWRRRPKRRWAHGVEVRQSRIPDAGDGLFAAWCLVSLVVAIAGPTGLS